MQTETMRQVTDEQGRTWNVVREQVPVAHLRRGARLAFHLAEGGEAAALATPIRFNSDAAADLAIRTMSEHELKRRLQWAKTDAGVR